MTCPALLLALALLISPIRLVNDWQVVKLAVTAYSPHEDSCAPWADGLTASGIPVREGVAAAPPEVPFGVTAYVPGHGWVEVQDRGGAIRGKALDLFMWSREDALEFGRQEIAVWVPWWLEWPENREED